MKKLFIISALFAALLATAPSSADAQMYAPKLLTTTSYGNTLDTVVNTAQKVTTPADGLIRNWKTGLVAMVVVTKISGTVAGSLALQGSLNGTDWVTVGSAASPSDATANYRFATTEKWLYYRISYTGSGTMSASFKSYIFTY